MKIAAVLFILSACYIANTEQAAAPAGVHTYPFPSRSWKEMEHKADQQEMENLESAKVKEMEHKAQLLQGMEGFEMKAQAFSQNAKA